MALGSKNKNYLSLQLKSNHTCKNKSNIYNNISYKYNMTDNEDDIYNHLPLSVLEINRSSGESKTIIQQVHYDSPTPGSTNDLTVGTLVEISNDISEDPLYGVIRWMGVEPSSKQILVGIELEEEQMHLPLILTDGVHNGQRFFKCAENRGIFVPLSHCHKDSRFVDGTPTPTHYVPDKMFGKEVKIFRTF